MSGGFFRGTSAEQDTRFSNKQAKLLKSQKFAAELDQPVDMTKIKMDVIRPWIATRATELLGFEDEVLINFVYGLLDGKEVDGKQIQIQLTGFLEKNTGKFMKELWGLLLSAQNNASGVPQQFLDAKEEEMKKKKVESDRITQEIQKRKEKEGREFEQEKQKRMDVEAGNSRYPNAVSASSSRHSLPWDSRVQSEKERDMEPVHSPRLKGREGDSRSASLSSQSRGRSISPSKRYHSPSRHSVSSERRHRSHVQRSISPLHKYSPRNNWSRHSRHESPYARRRSHSTPRHRSPSPTRRRSPYGRKSPSSLRHRSPPSRHRSPALNRRRSPSPGRHRQSPSLGRRRRSPSPGRRRSSPSLARRRRSPSLARRRSPSLVRRRRSPSPRRGKRSPSPRRRRRSPSPGRRRRSPSPGRRRRSLSPGHRRRSPSPLRHKRSPSPAHRRISLSPDRRSPSPLPSRMAAPARNRSPPLQRRISPSPSHRRSPTRLSVSPVRRRSVSPPPRQSPLDRSPQEQVRPLHSPRYHAADSQISPRARKRSHSPYSSSPSNPTLGDSNRVQTRSNGFESKKNQNKYAYERAHEKRSSVRDALHREVTELSDLKTVGHAPHQLPSFSRSVSRDSRDNDNHGKDAGAMSDNSSERSSSPGYLTRSPLRRNRLPEITVKQTEKRIPGDISGMNGDNKQATNIRERAYHKTDPSSKKGTDGQPSNASSDEEIGHKIDMDLPKRNAQGSGSLNDREYGAGRVHDEKNYVDYSRQQFFHSASDVELQPDSRNDANRDSHYLPESVKKSKRKMDTGNQVDNFHSDSEETDAHKHRNKEKRRHKHRRDSVDTSASDSDAEDRREVKRRRKDERRLRKEEKRRKREEKHRKRLERHRGKQQLKSIDTVTPPSDFEMDGVSSKKRSDALEAESEEKRLEIELRERALESLRARKAVGH